MFSIQPESDSRANESTCDKDVTRVTYYIQGNVSNKMENQIAQCYGVANNQS